MPLPDTVPSLSKSRYLDGLKCEKLLWYQYNAKEEIPPVDAATQAIFDQGHEVGALARSLFPGGIEIGGDYRDYEGALRKTAEAVKLRRPVFEGAFSHGGGFARADVLVPVGRSRWDLIEVKSSTEVKDVHVEDIALQKFVYAGAGLDIRRCELMYIDTSYVRRGDVDPLKLFARTDVTADADAILPEVAPRLARMMDVIGLRKFPPVPIGPQCHAPYDCPMVDICWDFLPARNVLRIARIGAKGWELLGRGILEAANIPGDFRLSGLQKIQVDAARTGKPRVDRAAIREFLSELEYPLWFLDFETFGTAIPLFDESNPYENIPFQFSLHVVRKEGAKPEHHGFLAEGKEDPRPALVDSLTGLIGERGSVIAYHSSFEKSVIKKLSEHFPRFRKFRESLEARMIDLEEPFRSLAWYHPDQEGSSSIKAVLPALAGKSYEGLAIAEGGTASREFLRVTYGEVPAAEREMTRRQLEEYCALDTSGMISVLDALRSLVR